MNTRSDIVSFATGLDIVYGLTRSDADRLLGSFVTVTEPSEELLMELISIERSGRSSSRKPGNILLNWRRLFDLAPDVGIAAAGAVGEGPFLRTLVALYVWNKVWRASEQPLSVDEASIIEALWREGGATLRTFSCDTAFVVTNKLRSARGLDTIARATFEASLDVLTRMGCITISNGEVWLREWVRKAT